MITALFLVVAGYVGLWSDLFKIAWAVEWPSFAIVAAVAFLLPSLTEELVFRAALAGRAGSMRAAAALIAFILWHPAQVWLGLPMAQDLFLDGRFLIIAAALGATCTGLYRLTGSIWPAVLLHWLVVLAWKGLTSPV
ncbi:CPBP family glutamic-type intramembrane protease [Maricaulis sp.]|uniref:CPBP family glutamic-type intramembrane protease n=1 Tax=Maricaulis sp. TaxID=1486257 RepID=UPI0026358FC1|nr:CPBP family glutamic-type intramembrane protease [Maricaulis sp.]